MKNNTLKALGLLVVVGLVYAMWNSSGLQAGEGSSLLLPALGTVKCERQNLANQETVASTQASSSILTVDNRYDGVQYEKLLYPAEGITCPTSYTPAGDWVPRQLNGKRMMIQSNINNQGWNDMQEKKYTWWLGNVWDTNFANKFTGQFQMKNSETTVYQLKVQCGYALAATPLESLTTYIDANNAQSFKMSWSAQVKKWVVYNAAGVPLTQASDNGCKVSTVTSLAGVKDSPTDTGAWATINKAITDIKNAGMAIAQQPATDGDISKVTDTTFADVGDSWNFIDEWRVAPSIYNIKTYNSQSVYCMRANNYPQLYVVKQITADGQTVWLPTDPIAGAKCCNDADCTQANQKCELSDAAKMFTCVDKPMCTQNVECAASCKEQWTYRGGTTDYLHQTGAATCTSGKCECGTEVTKCSPTSCISGQTCNLVKGTSQYGECIGPKKCPDGYWCDLNAGCAYQAAPCPSELKKCYTESSNCIGKCLANCPTDNKCTTDSDCDEGNPKTIDSCVKPLLGGTFCQHTPISGCVSDSDCDDKNSQTIDRCVSSIFSGKSCDHIPSECSRNTECGLNAVCTLDSNGAGHCESTGCAQNSDCKTGEVCTKDAKTSFGKCEAEKSCAEKFSIVTSPTGLFDCYIQEWVSNITKFVVSVTLFAGGAIVTSQLTRNTFKGKDDWKRPVISVIVGVILTLVYMSM